MERYEVEKNSGARSAMSRLSIDSQVALEFSEFQMNKFYEYFAYSHI